MTAVRDLTFWDFVRSWFGGWGWFPLPEGDRTLCPKDRRLVGTTKSCDWAHMSDHMTNRQNVAQVGSDGVGSGVPIQQGRLDTRTLYWGGGYGRVEQYTTTIPKPRSGGYWTTGYPLPAFDRHCIIVEAGDPTIVHELIQFDPNAPRRDKGWPQQAMGWGRWKDGFLIDGRPTTAPDLPQHPYIWGPGSADNPHMQGLVVDDYLGADGSKAFAARYPNGPKAGGWYALDPRSTSYARMWALGGECRARAEALAHFGCRITDRKMTTADLVNMNSKIQTPHLLTQAGGWAGRTNNHQFSVALADLREVV